MSKKIIIVGLIVIISIIISILFFSQDNRKIVPPTPPQSANPCVKTGCSGQLCQAKNNDNTITTCQWQDSYSCFQTAQCEIQPNGNCGFTQTTELINCLNQKSSLDKPTN